MLEDARTQKHQGANLTDKKTRRTTTIAMSGNSRPNFISLSGANIQRTRKHIYDAATENISKNLFDEGVCRENDDSFKLEDEDEYFNEEEEQAYEINNTGGLNLSDGGISDFVSLQCKLYSSDYRSKNDEIQSRRKKNQQKLDPKIMNANKMNQIYFTTNSNIVKLNKKKCKEIFGFSQKIKNKLKETPKSEKDVANRAPRDEPDLADEFYYLRIPERKFLTLSRKQKLEGPDYLNHQYMLKLPFETRKTGLSKFCAKFDQVFLEMPPNYLQRREGKFSIRRNLERNVRKFTIRCFVCSEDFSLTDGGGSIATNHYNRRHPELVKLLEEESSLKKESDVVTTAANAIEDKLKVKTNHLVDNSVSPLLTLAKPERECMLNTLAIWIARRARPLAIAEDAELVDLLMQFYVLGKYNFRFETFTTRDVRKQVQNIAESCRKFLTERLNHVEMFALTCDHWTSVNMTHFLATTIHFIDKNHVLHDRTLQITPVYTKQTGAEIKSIMTDVVTEYNLLWENCITVTTDGGKNMINAFKTRAAAAISGNSTEPFYGRISCLAHRLNNFVQYITGRTTSPQTKTKKKSKVADDGEIEDVFKVQKIIRALHGQLKSKVGTFVHLEKCKESVFDFSVKHTLDLFVALSKKRVDSFDLSKKLSYNEIVLELRKTVKKFRSMVSSMNHSTILKKLYKECSGDTALKMDVATRWNSTFEMLKSILDNKTAVKNYLNKIDQKKKEKLNIQDIDFDLIQGITMVLKTCKNLTEILSGSHYSTFPGVLRLLHDARLQSSINVKDADVYKSFKGFKEKLALKVKSESMIEPDKNFVLESTKALAHMMQAFLSLLLTELTPLHIYASFIDPNIDSFKLTSSIEHIKDFEDEAKSFYLKLLIKMKIIEKEPEPEQYKKLQDAKTHANKTIYSKDSISIKEHRHSPRLNKKRRTEPNTVMEFDKGTNITFNNEPIDLEKNDQSDEVVSLCTTNSASNKTTKEQKKELENTYKFEDYEDIAEQWKRLRIELEGENKPVNEFYKEKRSKNWKLLEAILVILSIPATSTPSERRFSYAGNTVTKLRSRLIDTLVRDLLLVQDTALANERQIEAAKQRKLVEMRIKAKEAYQKGTLF